MPAQNHYYYILSNVASNLGMATGLTCVARKKAIVLEVDMLPVIIVAPGPGGEKITFNTFNKNVVYEYPVTILYAQAGNRLTAVDSTFMQNREIIRNTLFQPFLSNDGDVWDTRFDHIGEAFEEPQWAGSLYDTTSWVVTYKVAEVRIS